jgi:hypothetical protein
LVFYVSGFDPQGPSHYHRLYQDEGLKQSQVSGYTLLVGGRRRSSPVVSGWPVDARFGTGSNALGVEAEIEFLRWDDIVRAHWTRSRWWVMVGALLSTWRQVRNGVLWRILKTSWPAFVVLAMPPILVLLLAAMAVFGLFGVGVLIAREFVVTGAVVAAIGAAGWRALARWAEERVQMAWLMRSTRFILKQARGDTPELEARLDMFGERIASAWTRGEFDEVLVVGHSSGAMLAVSAVARALKRVGPGPSGAGSSRAGSVPGGAVTAASDGSPHGLPPSVPLSLLTLGECIPMLSYQPEASTFRDELASLACSNSVEWIDFTAPPDGCCFALVDPTEAAAWTRMPAGVDPSRRWNSPKRLSARFAQMFTPARYEQLRRDKYRCHFQYLMATERPVDYDYFAITAGPTRLAARFALQKSVTDFKQFQTFGGVRS